MCKSPEIIIEKLRIETGSEKRAKMLVLNRSSADSTAKEKVTLPKAFAKIDPSDLSRSLDDLIPSSVEEVISKLVVYFGRALSGVTVEYKYPWSEMRSLIQLIDFPFRHIPEPIYEIAADWIDKVEDKTLYNFVIRSFKWTRDRLAGISKPTEPNSELGVFAALSMILRTRPLVLCPILPVLRQRYYHLERSPEMLQFTVWMMAQVAQVDYCSGLQSWASNLLPLVRDKLKDNPHSMDLILQLIENVLSHPRAVDIILEDAEEDEEDERLFPIPSFEILLPLTFPASFESVNVTERFVAVYPLLKEVALADEPDIEKMKEFTQCVFDLSLKFAEQGNPVLANEATSIAIWCLTKNVNCCNHWVTVYMDTPKASVALLKRLVEEWKDHSRTLSSSPSDTRIRALCQRTNEASLQEEPVLLFTKKLTSTAKRFQGDYPVGMASSKVV
uniref:Uncharacterized protein n=1 Tax=Noccaea caerulescens TaxID=107243 RepID=A0A1J3EWJ6_NOCCA